MQFTVTNDYGWTFYFSRMPICVLVETPLTAALCPIWPSPPCPRFVPCPQLTMFSGTPSRHHLRWETTVLLAAGWHLRVHASRWDDLHKWTKTLNWYLFSFPGCLLKRGSCCYCHARQAQEVDCITWGWHNVFVCAKHPVLWSYQAKEVVHTARGWHTVGVYVCVLGKVCVFVCMPVGGERLCFTSRLVMKCP